MDLRIYWTDSAKSELKNIFECYKENASLAVARKIVKRITEETLIMYSQPEKENFL